MVKKIKMHAALNQTTYADFPIGVEPRGSRPRGRLPNKTHFFRFFFVLSDLDFWPLTLTFELAQHFYTTHLTAKFHHPLFNRSEVIVLTNRQTDKQTNKQTPLKISTSLRYAMPEGINMMFRYTLVFTVRYYLARVLADVVCLSVRPSVRLSQIGVLLKRLNVGSRKQRHTIAQGLYVSEAENLGKTQTGQPQRGRQIQVG